LLHVWPPFCLVASEVAMAGQYRDQAARVECASNVKMLASRTPV